MILFGMVRKTDKLCRTPRRTYPYKDLYCKVLGAKTGGDWWAELAFHPRRRWRFDFACPESRVAIEIDGGVFIGGRHSGGVGQKRDFEKMNAAAELGWTVLHYTPDEKMKSSTFEQVLNTMREKTR